MCSASNAPDLAAERGQIDHVARLADGLAEGPKGP